MNCNWIVSIEDVEGNSPKEQPAYFGATAEDLLVSMADAKMVAITLYDNTELPQFVRVWSEVSVPAAHGLDHQEMLIFNPRTHEVVRKGKVQFVPLGMELYRLVIETPITAGIERGELAQAA